MTETADAVVQEYCFTAVTPEKTLPDMRMEVLNGLFSRPRTLPCKYFYDAQGSQLFDRICDTAEYYPTRTEASLLQSCANQIMKVAQPRHLVELGSGTSRKTRFLLNACRAWPVMPGYWPFDVCEPVLHDAASELMHEYPGLQVHALVGDYLAGLKHFPAMPGACLYVFLGGTLGNFSEHEALAFLHSLRNLMRVGDYFLVGADRVKDTAVLEAAYNDSEGLTAQFNLNILQVLNNELQANFNLQDFKHRAIYNVVAQQIEMYLIVRKAVRVEISALQKTLVLDQDETILTEISRKFTPQALTALLSAAGFVVEQHFQPPSGYFSLMLVRPHSAAETRKVS